MVPDTPTWSRCCSPRTASPPGCRPGKTVVDMSSISPLATKEFAKRINELGCDYLDAPVSGGEVGAKAASLTIMVGGPEAAFERVKPLFELMGKNITLVGGNGDGQTTKVANQIIVALNIEAVAEALVFAAKAGADPAKVRQALMGGFASSRILEVHGERMIKRTFDPGFRIELHQKDLSLALPGARALGVSLPNTATAQELFNACAANGGKGWDHSAHGQGAGADGQPPVGRRLTARWSRGRFLRDLFEAAVAAADPAVVPAGAPAASRRAAGPSSSAPARPRPRWGWRWSGTGRASFGPDRHPLRPRRAVRADRGGRGGASGARRGRACRGRADPRAGAGAGRGRSGARADLGWRLGAAGPAAPRA